MNDEDHALCSGAAGNMSSELLEPPEGGEPLCVFLLRDGGGEEERWREVGCQWESPEEERKEVGCQSDSAERRDAAVQVDLGWTHTGETRDTSGQLGCVHWSSQGTTAPMMLCHRVIELHEKM